MGTKNVGAKRFIFHIAIFGLFTFCLKSLAETPSFTAAVSPPERKLCKPNLFLFKPVRVAVSSMFDLAAE